MASPWHTRSHRHAHRCCDPCGHKHRLARRRHGASVGPIAMGGRGR
jgi:hypothetical protein